MTKTSSFVNMHCLEYFNFHVFPDQSSLTFQSQIVLLVTRVTSITGKFPPNLNFPSFFSILELEANTGYTPNPEIDRVELNDRLTAIFDGLDGSTRLLSTLSTRLNSGQN